MDIKCFTAEISLNCWDITRSSGWNLGRFEWERKSVLFSTEGLCDCQTD